MTKLGWSILALIVLAGLAFGSMVSFGDGSGGGGASPVATIRARLERPGRFSGGLVVPVAGVARSALSDNWGDPRGDGTRAHHGIDIMAPGGTPVVSASAGTVEKLFASERGGTTVYVRSPGRGWTFYYAHLAGYAPGLHEGQAVRAGDLLGYVGDTGDAAPSLTHLHFSVSRMRPEQRWWQGEDVNPYPLLAGKTP